ncbi:hypothetical protein AB4Z45_32185 [Paenibacillus sp. MCAF9]|uniref:hypothetical protein n=1 Tax=Paenibacillus sp. MCAF9 TaxID=3233046 RepID=UPI003F9B05AC
MELFVNNLFDRRDDEAKLVDCERVLWMNHRKDLVVTISIIDKKGLPQLKSLSAMQLEIGSGTLIKREADPYSQFMVPDEKLTPKEIQVRDHA